MSNDALRQLLKDLVPRSAESVDGSQKPGTVLTVEGSVVPSSENTEHKAMYAAGQDIGLVTNNTIQLKKLKPIHKKVIALHLAGWKHTDIAKYMERDPSWISNVICCELAKEVVANIDSLREEEFLRIRELADNAIRDALQPEKHDSVKLKAAALYYNRRKDLEGDKGQSAEDVMAKVLDKINVENLQININTVT